MALSTGSTVLSSDMTTVLTNVNKTLSRYGITNITSNHAAGTKALASYINTIVTTLAQADTHSYNYNDQGTTLTNNKVTAGTLMKAAILTTISTCATNIYNGYCSCNCDDCYCYCSCDCDFCSCNCDFCSCDCNFCSCDCDDCYCYSCYSCSCNCNNCYYSLYYCDLGTGYCCFLPDQYIITAQGPKQVQDIRSGDLILTAFGEFDEVESTWALEIEDKDVVNYKGDSFDLTVTEDHFVSLGTTNGNEEKVYYPYLKQSNTLPELRKDIKYSPYFLNNLLTLASNLTSFTNNIATFKRDNKDIITNLCSNLISHNLSITESKNTLIVSGIYNNIPFSQLFADFSTANGVKIFPSWIYTLPMDYYLTWHEQLKSNKITFNII